MIVKMDDRGFITEDYTKPMDNDLIVHDFLKGMKQLSAKAV